jgi:hypothetical protein
MATLTPSVPEGVAWFAAPGGGTANFTVDNATPGFGPQVAVEIWERVIPWSAATPPPPPPNFVPVPGANPISSPTPFSRPVTTVGSLYQVCVFFAGQGNPSGNNCLAKLDFPCLVRGAPTNMLSRCAGVPQIDISAGGTFVSMAFATAVATMVRVQLGANLPNPFAMGIPGSFAPADVVASVVSDRAKLIHKMPTDGLMPGNKFFFVILAWDAAGSWDFIWNTTGVAAATTPELVTLKRRQVSVRLAKLHVFDDSDALSDGEGEFKLVVMQAGTPQTTKFSSSFESGKPVIVPASMQVNIGPEVVTPATNAVRVRVDGAEDDSLFGIDVGADDLASTDISIGATGGEPLGFPVGEGKEEVNAQLLALPSKMLTNDEDNLSFLVEIRYSVNYVP